MNFNRAKSESCMYTKLDENKEIVCILSVYVDDILIAGINKEIDTVKESIKREFNIRYR